MHGENPNLALVPVAAAASVEHGVPAPEPAPGQQTENTQQPLGTVFFDALSTRPLGLQVGKWCLKASPLWARKYMSPVRSRRMEMCLPLNGLKTRETELPRLQEKTRRVERQKQLTWPLTSEENQTSKAPLGLPA
eukprot:6154667-Amphidinium_carterae.5